MSLPTQIIETLFPYLVCAAKYSIRIQKSIVSLPDKDYSNFFAQALTAADISVQNFVELAMMAHFPDIAFFGEEHEKSLNTAYIKKPSWESGEVVVMLDPIDGTRYFIDQHPNYQIIVSIVTRDAYLGAILISPVRDKYWYAIAGRGAWFGESLEIPPGKCKPFFASSIEHQPLAMVTSQIKLEDHSQLQSVKPLDILGTYSSREPSLMPNDLFLGSLNSVVYKQLNPIDSAVICFVAQEAGYLVETVNGESLPTPYQLFEGAVTPTITATSKKILDELRLARPVAK